MQRWISVSDICISLISVTPDHCPPFSERLTSMNYLHKLSYLWLPVGSGQWEGQQEIVGQERGVRVIFLQLFSQSFSWDTLVWLGLRNKEHNTVSSCTSSRLASGGPLLLI